MRFFIDNNLSEQLALGMRAFGEDVIHLKEKFKDNVDDTEWLEYIGTHDMFLITRDEQIRRRPSELQALLKYRVGAFFLGGKNLSRCDLIQQLVRNWPKIKQEAQKLRKPFAMKVRPRGAKFDRIELT